MQQRIPKRLAMPPAAIQPAATQGESQRLRLRFARTRFPLPVALALCVLLILLGMAACNRTSSPEATTTSSATTPAQIAVDAPATTGELQNASMALQPASGYGGLYVQVSGSGWPQNMMVLVTVEDAQGRSETLAASDTDTAGDLATGFLFPIDQRWFASDSLWVVASTADGRIETKASFEVVAPGSEIASTTTSTSSTATGTDTSTDSAVANKGGGDAADDATAKLDEQANYTVILPLIASTGPERRGSGRATRNSTAQVTTSGATQVEIEIYPGESGQVDCRNGDSWITIAIYSSNGFDATRIDPGSVAVTGGSPDLGYGGDSTVESVAFKAANKQEPTARSRQAIQWRWHLDDADGDGSIDMVMEFRLAYTSLDCNAAAVTVNGRTQDGAAFVGTNRITMLVVERS